MRSRDRSAVIYGAVLIALLVVLSRGVPAGRAWLAGQQAAAHELVAEAKRADALVAALPAMLDSAEARQRRYAESGPLLLPGETPAAAGAALAGTVSGTAAAANVRIGSVQLQAVESRSARPTAPSTLAGQRGASRPDTSGRVPFSHKRAFERIRVRANGTGDIAGLTRWLVALERGPTLLTIRELSVTQPELAADPARPEALRVDLVVEGIMLARPGKP